MARGLIDPAAQPQLPPQPPHQELQALAARGIHLISGAGIGHRLEAAAYAFLRSVIAKVPYRFLAPGMHKQPA